MADRDREMEDAWQSRCASQWPPPLVETLASGHSSQMRMNPHNTFHSFVAQEAPLQEHLIVQEPFVLNTLNLGLYKSGHTEGGNPVVSLLSGHVHHLPSTFSHLMNPGSAEPKLHSQNEVSTLCGTSSCIPSCSVSYGNDAIGNGRLSPFVASRPLLLSTGTTAPVLHNNIQVAGSHYHGPDLVMHQAIQANDRGLMVSSVKQNWPDVSDTANASQYHTLHIQTSKESPLEVKSATSGRATSGVAGRLHVYCLNTIGELFVNDMGLLGITCFCHSTNMSVANFCEHSGSSSANPGDAVHIENGLTLAQWCKLSFGPRALASGIWNWPTSSSAKGGSHGLNPSNLPNISKNLGSYQSPEASIGFGRSGESLNKFTYNNHLHPGAVGSYAMGKSANSFVNIACQRNTPNQPDFFRNFSGTPPSVMPALANNHSVQSVKGSPVIINFEASNSNGNKGEQNMGYQLVGDNVNYTSKCGNPSIIYPCSSTKKSLDNDFNIRSNFSSGQFVPDWSGAPSNVELRLGQPYQKSHTLLDSIPKSKHPQQFGAHFDLPKQQFHQPLTRGTICPREANKPWPNLQCTLPEASTPERRNLQHATSSASACNLSEPEETTGIAAKNSAISLFLSHLNYIEGNNLSHSTDNILNDTENVVMGEYDDDSTKCNLPNFRRDMNDATEGKSTINKSNISSRMEKGKELRVDDVGSYNSLKQDYLIKKKHTRDFEVPSPNVVGHYPYLTSLNDGQSTSYLHQELRPGVWNSEKCEEVSFMGESDHCDHLIHRSVNSIPCLTARCCSLNSKSPMSLSPTNPMFCSEPTPALSNVKDNHMTQNLLDENLSFLALRSMAELSKQERSTQALETSHQHGRMCCLSSTEIQRSARKDDLMAPEELREMPYCTVQKDGSSVAVRSVYPCSNCYYGSSVKPSMTCPKKCCKCTAVEQRISLSDKEHGIHSPSCIVCCSDRQALLRLGRFSNNNAMEGVKHEMYNQKERRPSFPGKCSCTLSTCLAACISGDSPCACKELEVCRKANTLPFNDDRSFKDNKIMKQGRCECSRKHVIMSNDSQSALWRNIPSEVIGQSDAVLIEEPAKVLEATGVVDQPTEASVKEYDKACEQHELMKEQQMSNACSESSAPAITEISSETNKVGFCAAEVGNAKSICDFVVDEGSGIEKCGSSDEALDNQEWEEAISFRNKVDSVCLFEEHKLQSSSTSKNVKNQKKSGFIIQEEINQMQRMCREEKLKGPMKWKRLDACNPISGLSIVNADCLESIGHHSSSKGIKAPVQQDNRKTSCVFFCKASGAKRKRSTRSLKRFENHHKVQEHGKTESSDDCSPKVMRLSALKKVKQDLVVDGKKESVKQKDNHETSGKPPKYMSLGCIGNSPNHGMDSYVVKVKPVVCGNSGIISNVLGSEQKPPKIVSLSVILKTARRCNISKDEWKPELSSVSETKKVRLSANTRRCSELSWKKQSQNGDSNVFLRSRKGPRFLIMPGVNKICSSKGDGCVDEVSAMKRGTDCENLRTLKHGDHHDYIDSQPRYDGTRKRSLSELTGEDMHAAKSTCLSSIGENSNLIIAGTELEKPPSQCITDSLIGRDLHCEKSCSGKILDSASPRNIGVISKSQFYRDHEQCQINMRRCSKRRKCQPFVFNSDAFCCVCGSSNKEEGNNLLECFHCLIRVHQACYGIPKAPKDRWCCRPCKANAKNIVCVLCGYEGGAMTRALKSRNVVKSLLKVWKIGIDSKPGKSVPPKMSKFPEPGLLGKTSGDNGSSLLALVGSASSGDVLRYSPKMDLQSRTNMFRQMDILSSYQSHNSITAGMLDPSVIQWVHMVCGLWTPGTKCPNVDTMSAFDVSGASPARKNTVCSICNRPGGSCIRCRVLNCTVNFHPWCAHQKGLLQSEVEGVDNEKVGFYGRCMLHVMHNSFHVDGSMDVEVGSSIQKDFSCARVEGFKGRKRDEGYKPHFQKPYNGGGCIVSQDQINAWIHINGQKSCTRSVVKPACSDIEYDFRKEYIRYKQAKGWRHLVVYKSGIHALGLYTSQFIARGAMVVEYVGEIVGLRVADKREIEYQSGRKMQYKSACYFFRIDKEHIIDATRKGGIARFVNHSCLPNCVAKIISIRNEKKVVFFAERDINPGEEITYDYHFNHEDEGQKIPCFCNSKNCRRYLN